MGQIEEKRAAHYAHLCELMPELVRRLSWSRRQIDAYQVQALRNLLIHARAHSPWHARRLAELDPTAVTLEDLPGLAPMTKSDLMKHWNEVVTVPGATIQEAEIALREMRDQFYIWGDHVLFTSGGTGGRPGVFVYDWTALALNWGGMARVVSNYVGSLPMPGNPNPQPIRIAAVGAEMSAHGSFVVGRIFSNPRNANYLLSGWRRVDDLIAKLNAIQPQLFTCYPHLVPALAAAVRAGELKIEPQVIACGGEPFPDESRRLAREAWPHSQILTCWGTSEAGGTYPCPLGDGFHVCEDQVIIEPIDGDGAPIKPGERSAGIYLTNLYNKAMPIIRYFIDDVFEMEEGPCPCGSHYQKVRQVHGRDFEKFHYGSIVVHPVTLQLAVLEQPRILEYQFRQTLRGAHLVFRSAGEVDIARLTTKMRDALLSYGLAEPEVAVECTPALPHTAAGKLRRFVPLAHEIRC